MSKTATSSGETKQDDIQLHFLGSVLIHPHAINEVPTPTDLGRWNLIFSFLDFDLHERLSVRNLCRLFHTVLPGPTFTGVYTIYPHPNHTSLRSLIDRLNAIASGGGSAEYLFIAKGVHDEGGEVVTIDIPISIVGKSREHCIVMGGLMINGNEELDVNVSNLTLRGSKKNGVFGFRGASFHLDNVSVENSEYQGVYVEVEGTKRSTMKNCNVSHSKKSGILVEDGGLMTIEGKGTTIHHNCTDGDSWAYGLHAYDSNCSIHLASSLTIETISKNNEGGRNYGGKGRIAIVDNEGTIIKTIQEATVDSSSEDDY